MPSALDLITASALKLGAIESGESLTADEANDSLDVLNSMLDYWANNKLLVYQIVQSSYTWPASTTSRTIGSGGNFSATRPIRIEEGTIFRDSDNADHPVFVVRERSIYDGIVSKSDQAPFPDILFYDPAYPLGVLYVYPVPSQQLTLLLNSWQTLQSFSALTTDLALPPGYRWLIEHNLAVHLEALFNIGVPDSVVVEANKSMATMERVNNIPVYGATDAAAALTGVGHKSNIFSG